MEGYWLTHYHAGTAQGDGIAMLSKGELLGGDLEHVWSGTYEEEGTRLHARIRIVPFVSRPEEETMARDQPMILSLEGYCTEDYARLEGHPDHREDLMFEVEMRKCKSMQGRVAVRPAACGSGHRGWRHFEAKPYGSFCRHQKLHLSMDVGWGVEGPMLFHRKGESG